MHLTFLSIIMPLLDEHRPNKDNKTIKTRMVAVFSKFFDQIFSSVS